MLRREISVVVSSRFPDPTSTCARTRSPTSNESRVAFGRGPAPSIGDTIPVCTAEVAEHTVTSHACTAHSKLAPTRCADGNRNRAREPDATGADEPPLSKFHVPDPGVRAKNFPVTDPPSGSDTVAANTGVCDSTSSVANPDGAFGAAANTAAAPATTTAATLTATTTAGP